MAPGKSAAMSGASADELLRASLNGGLVADSELSSAFTSAKEAGNAAMRAGRFNEAIAAYTRAEAADPCSAVPPLNRAQAHLRLHNYQEANADASVALALLEARPDGAPRNDSLTAKAYFRRATARAALHMRTQAVDDYRAVLRLQPENREARERLDQLSAAHESSSSPTPGISVLESTSNPAMDVERPQIQSARVTNVAGNRTTTAPQPIAPDTLAALVAKDAARPPESPDAFERAWRGLKGAPANDRAVYIAQTVGAERLEKGLLGHSLTAQLLMEIVRSFRDAEQAVNAKDATNTLLALSKLPRFEIAVLLLNHEERLDVKHVLTQLDANGAGSSQLSALRQAYSV